MARIKSWFITPYLVGLTVAFMLSAGALSMGQWSWGGLLLLSLPTAVVTVVHVLHPYRARTSRRYPAFVVLGLIGWGLTFVGWPDLWPVLAGATLFLGLLLYLYWYSEFGVATSGYLTPGQRLPRFTARDLQGQEQSSESLRGTPALILFYRGNWCPVCTAQIRELAASYAALTSRGIRVVLVSPQPDTHTAELATRVALPFEFWHDQENAAARTLGIVDPAGLPLGMEALGYGAETPVPTALLVDADGVILYSDQAENYRVRPEPREYLDAFDRAQASRAEGA